MNHDVFISYSRKNYDTVMEIKRQIDSATGAECWIDLKGIESGSDLFIKDIIGGIDNCKVFLFMLSKESQLSDYALLELNYAKQNNKRVVLVNIDDCKMKGVFLFKYSLTDIIAWNESPQKKKLIRDLCEWIGTKQKHDFFEGTSSLDKTSEIKPAFDSRTSESSPQSPTANTSIDPQKHIPKPQIGMGYLHRFRDTNGKYGFKDKAGKIIIPCQWIKVHAYKGNLARVKNMEGKWGCIDEKGNIVIPCQWKQIEGFNGGLAMVKNFENKWGFIDNMGKIISPCQWKKANAFREGFAIAQNFDNKWGFIDNTGKLIIPCQWKQINGFNEGLAMVQSFDNKWGFIDNTGKLIIPCQWDKASRFNKGFAMVQNSEKKWGFINMNGKMISPCQWKQVADFCEGLSRVQDFSDKWGFIDINGNVIIPCNWDKAKDFKKGKASVFKEMQHGKGKYHLIDKTGKLIF